MQPLKNQRMRRLQTLFGTVEVEAPRFKVCGCHPPVLLTGVTFSLVYTLLTTRCAPKLERTQAELGARPLFRNVECILEILLPSGPRQSNSRCSAPGLRHFRIRIALASARPRVVRPSIRRRPTVIHVMLDKFVRVTLRLSTGADPCAPQRPRRAWPAGRSCQAEVHSLVQWVRAHAA